MNTLTEHEQHQADSLKKLNPPALVFACQSLACMETITMRPRWDSITEREIIKWVIGRDWCIDEWGDTYCSPECMPVTE